MYIENLTEKRRDKMGGSKVKKHVDLLVYLSKISPRQQKMLIHGLDRSAVDALAEVALNLIKKNVALTPAQIDKLRPHEESIYQLALKKNSVARKKRLLRQKGGFLGTLVSLIPAIVSGIVAATT